MSGGINFCPPYSNRGGNFPDVEMSQMLNQRIKAAVPDAQEYERYTQYIFNSKGKLVEVPLRRGKGNTAFIDSLSVTFDVSSLDKFFCGDLYGHFDYIMVASSVFSEIFGFGITEQGLGSGNRRYKYYYKMEVDGVRYGTVHIGGQNDTMLLELSGKGCEVAKDGWEQRLYNFLMLANRPHITRCDVARDFFDDEISPDSAYQLWQQGQFNRHGKQPIIDRYGSDWDCDTKHGKTLYVGSKHSGVYTRIYDKAKQQGDKQSFWTRVECQFMGRNCHIDLDILIKAGEFWGGAYPALADLQKGMAKRRTASNKRLEMSLDHCKKWAAQQCGRAINALIALGMSANQIVEELRNKQDLVPARLNPAAYDLIYATQQKFIHHGLSMMKSFDGVPLGDQWDTYDLARSSGCFL